MGATTTVGDVGGGLVDVSSVAESYIGKPLLSLAWLLGALLSRVLSLLFRRDKTGASFNKSASSTPQQPLVRLQNLPQSEEYFINKRRHAIHFRSYSPESADAIKAVVLFVHGYGAHCNSPQKHQMGMSMPAKGLCMYQMDLEGHGYSGGERAYIEDYNHWVDDYRQLLELVAGDRMDASHGGPSEARDNAVGVAPHFLRATAAQRKRLREVPIFICGESLGGALSILLGLSLHESNHPLLPRFKGQVLLAPAIKGNPPPPILVAALRHLVVPIIPRWQIPSCLESVNRPELCVLEVDKRRHANHDVLGYPGGLGWGGNMRFRTGLNLIDLTAEVSRRLEHVKFPFLIMHDPGDCIVQFDSSRELAYRASTPHGSPRGREVRQMKGWLHCLLTNCPEISIQHLQDWVLYQTRLYAGGSGSHQPQAQRVLAGEGSSARDGGITRRGGITRKSVLDVGAADSPAAATEDDSVAPEGGAGQSPSFDGGDGLSGVLTYGGRNGTGSGTCGHGTDNISTVAATAHTAAAAATIPVGAPDTLLDFFPQTAAAAAVTAAAMRATGDAEYSGADNSTHGAVDLSTSTRQQQPLTVATERMRIEGIRNHISESGGPGAEAMGGDKVVADSGMRTEPEPQPSLEGDLNIDSPSRVAGIQLSSGGGSTSGMSSAATDTAAPADGMSLVSHRDKFV